MSQDKSEIKTAIGNIELSGFGGTDLSEAIITSTNLLENEENKAIVLLSDGQANTGTLDDAISYANYNNVLVHTIAIGTKEGGQTAYAISKVDEDSLKGIAYMTGGNYSSAETQNDLTESFENLLQLTKQKVSIGLSNYLILFSILLLVFRFLLTNTKFVNLP